MRPAISPAATPKRCAEPTADKSAPHALPVVLEPPRPAPEGRSPRSRWPFRRAAPQSARRGRTGPPIGARILEDRAEDRPGGPAPRTRRRSPRSPRVSARVLITAMFCGWQFVVDEEGPSALDFATVARPSPWLPAQAVASSRSEALAISRPVQCPRPWSGNSAALRSLPARSRAG